MNTEVIIPILIQAGSFIAAFAAVTAFVIMRSVTKKFGTGILASGFHSIATGTLLIALGIIVDAVNSYILTHQVVNLLPVSAETYNVIILVLKDILFVAGTYVIVIGSKSTGDKLESLTK